MKRLTKKVIILSSVTLILGSNLSGVVKLPFAEQNIAYAAEQRITLVEFTLSAQQVRDWAKSIRDAKSVVKSISGGVSFLGRQFKSKNTILLGALIGLSAKGPNYFKTVQKAADQGKRLKVKVTDYKNYHTSYSVNYELTLVK